MKTNELSVYLISQGYRYVTCHSMLSPRGYREELWDLSEGATSLDSIPLLLFPKEKVTFNSLVSNIIVLSIYKLFTSMWV